MGRKSITIDRSKRVYEIANLRLQGKPTKDIHKIIEAKYSISKTQIQKDIAEALEKVRSFLDKDILNVRVIHAKRYEKFYDFFYQNKMYTRAMDCLYLIERLVGLHSSKMTFNIEQIIEHRKSNVDLYDYSRLSEKEIKRLKFLYNKVKID